MLSDEPAPRPNPPTSKIDYLLPPSVDGVAGGVVAGGVVAGGVVVDGVPFVLGAGVVGAVPEAFGAISFVPGVEASGELIKAGSPL